MARMIVPILMLAMFAQNSPNPKRLGSALYAHCQEAVRILDNTRAGGDLQSATECTAYIDGFTDALLSLENPLICTGTASVSTMTRIYVAYMQKNPKLLDQSKSLGLTLSLIEAYPCQTK
jgi:hypothetical protein